MAIDPVLRYLSSLSFKETQALPERAGKHAFVTISRQAGAGAHALAEILLKKLERRGAEPLYLNWRVYDQEICRMVAEDPKLSAALQALLSERYRSEMEDYFAQLVAGTPAQLKVMHRVFRTVWNLASVGQAVIIGRGAACLTRPLSGGVHVRLVAPRELRVQRTMKTRELGKLQAEQWVDAQDSARARLVKTHFRRDIDDPLLYDAVWSTHNVPLTAIADSIVSLLEARAASVTPAETRGIGA